MTTIGVLEGSLRAASLSRALARASAGLAPEGVTMAPVPSPGTVPLYNQDVLDQGVPEPVSRMADAISAVDALLIVSPEYNWSVPGVLKNAIDWISRLNPNPLEGKAVSIWTVSPGALGGARAHESLRQVLHSQGMVIMAKPEVQVAAAKSKVDVEKGLVSDEVTAKFLREHLEKFLTFSNKAAG